MAWGNVDIVRDGYAHFNEGDLEWLLQHVHPAVRWSDSRSVPGARTHRGIEEVRDFLASFGRVWEGARFDPEKIEARGDKVLSFVRFSATGRHSGASVAAELAHVFEFREGRTFRVVTYFDRGEAELDFERDELAV